MIINNKSTEVEKTIEGRKATINQEKLGKLQYLLTKGLYGDPIGAVVVEWAK